MSPRSDGAFGDPQHVRDFTVRQLGQLAEDDHTQVEVHSGQHLARLFVKIGLGDCRRQLVRANVFLGLRLDRGIDADWSAFQPAVERFIREGLLETNGNVLRLTRRGVLLSNEVFAEFV